MALSKTVLFQAATLIYIRILLRLRLSYLDRARESWREGGEPFELTVMQPGSDRRHSVSKQTRHSLRVTFLDREPDTIDTIILSTSFWAQKSIDRKSVV